MTYSDPTTTTPEEIPGFDATQPAPTFMVYMDGKPRFGFEKRSDVDHAIQVGIDGGRVREIRVTGPEGTETHTIERRVTVRRESDNAA